MRRIVWCVAIMGIVGVTWCGLRASPQAGGLVSVALADDSCQCPEKQCANGKVAGCRVTCPAGQDAVCVCDGFCDDDGTAGGLNRCACQ